VPQSTVGYEKLFNASVRAAESQERFVRHILEGQPEPPLYFSRMKRVNKEGPAVLGGVPLVREVGAGELRSVDARREAIVDTRPWAEFARGHLPGAMSQPLGNSFSTDAGSMIDAAERVYLIVERSRLDEVVRALIRVGVDNLGGWFDAANMDEYVRGGGVLTASREVGVEAARAMVDREKPFVLDVRRGSEFAEGHIPGAVNITHTRLLSRLDEVPRGESVLVNCRSGARSSRACALLERYGYSTTNLAGGILAWERGGGAITGRKGT
jgi:hydroxyacylglutathione hydrolase